MYGEHIKLRELLWWQKTAGGGGGLPWQTFSGNPLQFNAPKAHTLKSATVEFAPKQEGSGDPSPDNVRPISGWSALDVVVAGENLVYTSLGNRNIDSTGKIVTRSGYALKIAQVKKGATYVISTDDDGGAVYAFYTSEPQTDSVSYNGARVVSVDNFVFEAPIDGFVAFRSSSGYQYAQLNLGSTASPYATYTGSTTTLSFSQTVYGGTASVAEDGSVDVTVTMAEVDMGSLSWGYNSSYGFITTSLRDSIKNAPDYSTKGNLVCSIFKTDNYSAITSRQTDFCIGVSGGNYGYVVVSDSDYTDKESFTTAVTGQKLVYELATPIVIHLSSVEQLTALKGINTMWTDGDSLTVEARAEAVNLSALQSLNMLLGGRYVNNHTAEDLTDEEALDVILGGQR